MRVPITASALTMVLILGAGFGCGSPRPDSRASAIPDGLYLMLSGEPDDPAVAYPSRTIAFRHDLIEGVSGEPDSVVIVPSEYVPLELSRAPEGVKEPDDRLTLLLSMTTVAGEQLADFTEKHLGARVGMVIGGQAVTAHKVKSRIEGGKLQITRCTGNFCEQMLVELRDNVKNE